MRGLAVPEQSEDFTADPVELFFDLAFVFAFSQIVHMLVGHPDWEHVGKAGLIFLMLWMPWSQFTWSANAVPGNQRSVRIAFLIATAASVPMAAAVETAFEGSGALFAIPLAVIFLMGLSMIVSGLETGTDEYRSALRYALPSIVAMLIIFVGGFVPGTARYVFWIGGVAVFVWSTIRAGEGDWVIRPGHFAERHGLIIIVALGEVVVALGNAVVDPLSEGEGFSAISIVALAATGVAAAALWWSYFDRVQPAIEHRAEEQIGRERGRFARDAYTYAHMPIVAGVILTAVGLEDAALHPDAPLALPFRMILLAGIALFIGGIGIGTYRAFKVVPLERVGAVLVVAVFLVVAGSLNAVWLIVVIDIAAIAGLVAEHVRVEVHSGDSKIHHDH